MRTVEDFLKIREAYFKEKKSIRAISRKYGYGRNLVRKAIVEPAPLPYKKRETGTGKVLGPYEDRIKALLLESEELPQKQRFTANNIYKQIQKEGYQGSAGGVHNYISRYRKETRIKQAYLPLAFEPGEDAQVDWGEAVVVIQGKHQKVQFFTMRLNYSRVRFVMAFPFQKQEAFLEGHIQAFRFLKGIPKRITYDNLKTAVFRILEGHNRQEQEAFLTFRSYYLFESYYCNPGEGHEKGGVENDVGYAQRNFFSPVPQVESFEELNLHLLKCCQENMERSVWGKKETVSQLWQIDRKNMLPLPTRDYPACKTKPVKVNPYSQVVYETNRYSVPVQFSGRQLVLRAYSFRIEVLYLDRIVAVHPRCFDRQQEIYDPIHYLPLLQQRPGAFQYAVPIKKWRKEWPKAYEELLIRLQDQENPQQGIREFISILHLHRDYPAEILEEAVSAALRQGMPNLDGVLYQVRRQLENTPTARQMDLTMFPKLQHMEPQSVDLYAYNRLLRG